MARTFPSRNSDYASHAGNVITAAPLSWAGWFYDVADSSWLTVRGLGAISDYDSANGDGWRLELNQKSTNAVHTLSYVVEAAGSEQGFTTGDLSGVQGAWRHYAVVVHASDSTDVSIWFEGTEYNNTSLTATTPSTNVDRIGPNVYFVNSAVQTNSWDGYVADLGFWGRAITDAEIAILSKGYSPLFVSDGLKHYLSMKRTEDFDLISGDSLTLVGTPGVATHPPKIIYPAPPFISYPTAAAAANAPTGHLLGPLYGPLGGPIAA